jgi:hypothetical protein
MKAGPGRWAAETRATAHLISHKDGGPAYGGTPDDAAVIEAIRDLKARGLKVTLYPFVLMDVPEGNVLPSPDGSASQPAYPWRGRITASPARDLSAAQTEPRRCAQKSDLCGATQTGDFAVTGEP